jgi:hypothetical protein
MARVPSRELVPTAPWNRHWPLLLPAVGRRLKWRLGRGPISFTLQSLSVAPGLSGWLREVRLTASDVDVDHVRLESANVLARNVRLRSTSVVANHVELNVRLGQAGLDALLENGMPYAKLHLDGDVGRAELVAHPGWGHVELQPRVDDGSLVLEPVAVVTGRRRWKAPVRALPRLRIGAHVLLPGSRLVGAVVHGDHLDLTAELEDVSLPLLGERDVVDLRDPPDRD